MIVDIFERAGVVVKPSTTSANEITVCCPFCEERSESADTRFRLGINIRNGLSHCFNCNFKAYGVSKIARELCRVYGLPPVRAIRAKPEPVVEEQIELDDPEPQGYPDGYERFNGKEDPIQLKARNYLAKRQVSLLEIVRHKIGFAAVGPMAWRVLFPVLGNDGLCYGCVGRDFSGMQKPVYLNTPGTKLLWGANRYAGTVVVVEGVMDALRVEKALLTRRSIVAVAHLGSGLNPAQLVQLKAFEKVILFPDQDRAGVEDVLRLAKKCCEAKLDTWVSIPERMDGRDPGDMNSDELLSAINDAQQWSRSTEWRLRASAAKEMRDGLQSV